jgi:ferric-dicitrate binding protein FerR (iron transport regulator)
MPSPFAAAWAARAARRYGPVVARAAYKRWKAMSPEEKERYRQQMRGAAARGRAAVAQARDRGRRPPIDGGPERPPDRPRDGGA